MITWKDDPRISLHSKDDTLIVYKRFRGNTQKQADKERHYMQFLQHPNIIKIINWSPGWICMEYGGGNLTRYDQSCNIKSILTQVLEAVVYMHDKRVIHGDIRPHNIVMLNGVVKVIDFHSAEMEYSEVNSLDMTYAYSPLENLLGSRIIRYSTDMWSIGCLMYELINKKRLFEGIGQISTISEIVQKLGLPKASDFEGLDLPHLEMLKSMKVEKPTGLDLYESPYNELIQDLLQYCPYKRPTAQQVLQRITNI